MDVLVGNLTFVQHVIQPSWRKEKFSFLHFCSQWPMPAMPLLVQFTVPMPKVVAPKHMKRRHCRQVLGGPPAYPVKTFSIWTSLHCEVEGCSSNCLFSSSRAHWLETSFICAFFAHYGLKCRGWLANDFDLSVSAVTPVLFNTGKQQRHVSRNERVHQ